MVKRIAAISVALFTLCASASLHAQDKSATNDSPQQAQTPAAAQQPAAAPQQAQAAPAAPEKETWKAPFGGTFNANFTFATDYSYRGISQTSRNPAFQMGFGYETAQISENIPISAYASAWGSNVIFPGTGATFELDTIAGLRLKALNEKLLVDLSWMRYNYPGSNPDIGFIEYGLLLGYDFDVAQLTFGLHYSPNFFANSGLAWYKQLLATVPLPFIKLHEDLAFKLFGSVGTQYVANNTAYGISSNNYWDWQVGLTMTAFTVDFSVSYVGTSVSPYQDCANTQNCANRVLFTVSKTF